VAGLARIRCGRSHSQLLFQNYTTAESFFRLYSRRFRTFAEVFVAVFVAESAYIAGFFRSNNGSCLSSRAIVVCARVAVGLGVVLSLFRSLKS
jgi:hypothetical protein